MSKDIDKETIIAHKKASIKKLNATFEAFLNNPDTKKYLKKADLLAYWVETYSDYILNEKSFDYKKVMKFRRGEVVRVNLGFKVGSEQGGLRYAIVLDNDNKQSSSVITVLPLTSGVKDDAYFRDIYLGDELYTKLNAKYLEAEKRYENDNNQNEEMIMRLKQVISESPDVKSVGESEKQITELLMSCEEKKIELQGVSFNLKKQHEEIIKLKFGSIALMEQITAISKMRIYKPKSKNDLLYGIKFSDDAMDKVNERLKELYIFSK